MSAAERRIEAQNDQDSNPDPQGVSKDGSKWIKVFKSSQKKSSKSKLRTAKNHVKVEHSAPRLLP